MLPKLRQACLCAHVLQGPDVGDQLEVLSQEAGEVASTATEYVPIAKRMEQLKAWAASQSA